LGIEEGDLTDAVDAEALGTMPLVSLAAAGGAYEGGGVGDRDGMVSPKEAAGDILLGNSWMS
jgi:hypothetical protein